MSGAGCSLPSSCLQGQLTHTPVNSGSSIVLPEQSVELALPLMLQQARSTASSHWCRKWGVGPTLWNHARLILVVSGAKDINTDSGCSRIMDLAMGLGSSSGLIITMAPGGKEATLLLITFISSALPLYTGYEALCLYVFLSYHIIYLLTITVTNHSESQVTQAGRPVFSPWYPGQCGL